MVKFKIIKVKVPKMLSNVVLYRNSYIVIFLQQKNKGSHVVFCTHTLLVDQSTKLLTRLPDSGQFRQQITNAKKVFLYYLLFSH